MAPSRLAASASVVRSARDTLVRLEESIYSIIRPAIGLSQTNYEIRMIDIFR